MDILKYPTLSSLSFAIYRSNFLENSKIPLINGEIYDFIKNSYSGGSVDVYKPFSKENKEIKRYDANSLYPYAMKIYNMPVGYPTFFEGDVGKIDPNAFGIFEVEVEAPNDIKIPILQVRVKTKNGYRTIAPIGNWKGHYFSGEIYNAMELGYKFKILRGYLFEKEDIFSKYVDFLYTLKKESKKDSPDYLISKMLLNSLYGRLGMSPIMEKHIIVKEEDTIKLHNKHTISKVIPLLNGKELISFFDNLNNNIEETFIPNKNISIVVSSIVTASARIYMSKFKKFSHLNIYYTDTDSIDVDQELDPKYVGEELGQMKLEHTFKEAIFLAPKVYGGLTDKYEYVKIKGLKNPIPYSNLKGLLKKDSKLEIEQDKWYRDISKGEINIKNEIYTLMVTDNKRKLIYDQNNILVDTAPLFLKDGEIIEKK